MSYWLPFPDLTVNDNPLRIIFMNINKDPTYLIRNMGHSNYSDVINIVDKHANLYKLDGKWTNESPHFVRLYCNTVFRDEFVLTPDQYAWLFQYLGYRGTSDYSKMEESDIKETEVVFKNADYIYKLNISKDITEYYLIGGSSYRYENHYFDIIFRFDNSHTVPILDIITPVCKIDSSKYYQSIWQCLETLKGEETTLYVR